MIDADENHDGSRIRQIVPTQLSVKKGPNLWKYTLAATSVVILIVLVTTIALLVSKVNNDDETPVWVKPTQIQPVSDNSSTRVTQATTSTRPKPSTRVPSNEDDETEPFAITEPDEPDKSLNDHTKSVLNEFSLNLNPLVDPCDDFYKYACGSFSNRYQDGQKQVTYFSLEYDKMINKTIEVLNGDTLKKALNPLQKLKKIWDSCVNDRSDTSVEIEKLKEYFEQLDKLPSWQEKFARATRDGYNVLITVKSEPDPVWATIYVVSIGKPKLQHLIITSAKDDYFITYYSELIALYKDDPSGKAKYLNQANEILQFERAMYTNGLSEDEKVTSGYAMNNKLSIEELERMSHIKWRNIIEILTGENSKFVQKLMVNDMNFISKLTNIINTKDEAFLSEYIKLAIIRQSCFVLGNECREMRRRLIHDVLANEIPAYKETYCFNLLKEQMEELMFKAYLTRISPNDDGPLDRMVGNLVIEFRKLVSNLPWMDDSTKSVAQEKINLAQQYAEFNLPAWLKDDSIFEKKYEDLPVMTEDVSIFDHFSSLIGYNKDKEMKRLNVFNKGYEPWPISLFSSTCKFLHQTIAMYVPNLLLEGHFYDKDYTSAMKYGMLGFMLAHEMTHSFDETASKFCEQFKSKDQIQPEFCWADVVTGLSSIFWTQGTKEEYHKQMKCFKDTYGPRIAETEINGIYKLDELLADLIGLRVAYNTNIKVNTQKDTVRSEYPDSLKHFTSDQMFFLSYANVHCSSDAGKSGDDLALNVESLRKYKVNVPLKHMEQFAKAFQCRTGSRMNLGKKCSIV